MKKIEGWACEYWIENTDRIYKENLHVSAPVIEAYEAGFKKARELALELEDKYSGQFKLRKYLENMGEEEE